MGSLNYCKCGLGFSCVTENYNCEASIHIMTKLQNISKPEDFFILGHIWAHQYFWSGSDLSVIPEEFWRNAMKGFKGKLQVKIVKGGVSPDVLGCGALLFIVSERILEVFEKYGFQKYDTYPVEITDGRKGKKRNIETIPKYYGMYFLGKGGRIDDKAS
jgi:hypothetical protein